MQTETKITVNGVEHTIRKAPIGKYAKLVGVMQKIPGLLNDIAKMQGDRDLLMSKLPELFITSYPDLLSIISVLSDIPEATINDTFGLDDITDLFTAFFQVNDFSKVKKNVSVLMKMVGYGKLKTAAIPQTPGEMAVQAEPSI